MAHDQDGDRDVHRAAAAPGKRPASALSGRARGRRYLVRYDEGCCGSSDDEK